MKIARMIVIGYAAFCVVFLVFVGRQFHADVVHAQQAATTWADVTTAPGLTVVILRDNAPEADQLVVRTFFYQTLQGIEKPVLRSVFDVIPAIKNTAVAATGAPDPTTVDSVHIDTIKITSRLEWKPTATKP